MMSARAIGNGMTVRCLNSHPPTRVSIEQEIVLGPGDEGLETGGLETGGWRLGWNHFLRL
jgi:hypothetical protein